MAPRGFLRSAAFLLFETRIWLPVKMVRTQLLQEPPSTLSVVTAPGVVQGPLCVHRYCVMGGGKPQDWPRSFLLPGHGGRTYIRPNQQPAGERSLCPLETGMEGMEGSTC